MGAVVSLDGFMADDHDGIRPLFDWCGNRDVNWTFPGGDDEFGTTRVSADFICARHRDVACLIIGRRVFDVTNGWNGKPRSGRARLRGDPRTTCGPGACRHGAVHLRGRCRSGPERRTGLRRRPGRDVSAGQIGGQAPRAGLIDQVVVNLVPVVLGSGRPFFATGGLGDPILFDNPSQVIRGDRVTHLVFDVAKT